MSDKKMTLEQVRDEILNTARAGARLEPQTCHYLADAIDAELKARGEPVATACDILDDDDLPDGSIRWTGNALPKGTKLYTAPPTSKIEITDAMVERLWQFSGWSKSSCRVALEVAFEETP